MKHTYSLTQQFIARFIIISLFLQSCTSLSSPIIPVKNQAIEEHEKVTNQANIEPILGKQLTAAGGNLVTFRKETGHLVADVKVNAPQEFSKSYQGLNVYIEQGTELATLSQLDTKAQERRIHLQLAKGNQPAKVIIYKGAGLMGGGNTLRRTEFSFEQCKEAAKQGDAAAQNNLGVMYEDGNGVAQNHQKAEKWYRRAAKQGHVQAQYNLGVLYYNGEVVKQDYKEAIKWYKKAASKGYVEAQYNLGMLYHNGEGATQDYAKAKEWYKKAASKGDVEAQNSLGVMYYNGEGATQDYAKAKEWYKKAASKGYVEAQYNLGVMYYNGEGVEKNYAKAAKWYDKAAKQGDAAAQYSLGVMYYNGEGVEKVYAKAKEWYKKAAHQGDAGAQYNLGIMYANGEGVNKSYKKAAKWYKKAASKGDVEAQNSLGVMYYNGEEGVEKNYAKAAKWYDKAAHQGDAAAQNVLGIMYHNGIGVERNYVKAREYYDQAAKQGNPYAQNRLGLVYYTGEGVEKDYAKAVELFRQAANQGDVYAQYQLGAMYYKSEGVEKDYAKAREWYEKAAEQGDADEQYHLGMMYYNGEGEYQISANLFDKYFSKFTRHPNVPSALLAVIVPLPFNFIAIPFNCPGGLRGFFENYPQALYHDVSRDYGKAKEWFERAANRGNAAAQYQLGKMYEDGRGVEEDFQKAAEWYLKASEHQNNPGRYDDDFRRVIGDNYRLDTNFTKFRFDKVTFEGILLQKVKNDYVGTHIFKVDKSAAGGSSASNKFSKQIARNLAWSVNGHLAGSLNVGYKVGVPILGGSTSSITGTAQVGGSFTWTSNETETIDFQVTSMPKEEGTYEMRMIVRKLNDINVPFTARAKLTAVPKNTQGSPFTAPIVKKLYQINNCTYDLEHPIEQDDTSLTIELEGKMEGTYNYGSYTSIIKKEEPSDESSRIGRDVSQEQSL